MTTRNLITIPNHPVITSITRTAQVLESQNIYKNNTCPMSIGVHHYMNDVEITYMYKEVQIVADNTMIDPNTLAYVVTDDNKKYPDGSIGEFDYLYNLVNVLKTHIQSELEEMYINLRIDRINDKLYS